MAKYKNNDIIKGLDNNLYIVRPMEKDYGLNKCLGCIFNHSTTKRHEHNCNVSMRKRTLQEFKNNMYCYQVIDTNHDRRTASCICQDLMGGKGTELYGFIFKELKEGI